MNPLNPFKIYISYRSIALAHLSWKLTLVRANNLLRQSLFTTLFKV